MIRLSLAPNQDEDSCKQRQHASYNPDAKSSQGENPNRYEINREQKHADIFSNHVVSIDNYTPT